MIFPFIIFHLYAEPSYLYNSDKLSKSTLFVDNVYYSEDQVVSIGGFEACLMDAIKKIKFRPTDHFMELLQLVCVVLC